MLHDPKAAASYPVPQNLRQWLQAWRACFTAPSWGHTLVLVMAALLAPGKRTVSSWLAGDKAMSDYEPSDISTYVRRMALIPKNFTLGSSS